MKYKKFVRLMTTNSDIQWLPEFIGPPRLRFRTFRKDWSTAVSYDLFKGADKVEIMRKKHIEEVVEFIAFRDWDKIDLSAPVSSVQDIIFDRSQDSSREDIRRNIASSREEVRYGIAYHLEEDADCHRFDLQDAWARSQWAQDPWRQSVDIPTLRGLLENYWIWSRRKNWDSYNNPKCRDIIFDAVVKITRIWDGDWECYVSEKVEIFRIPEHLKPQSVWVKRPEAWAA